MPPYDAFFLGPVRIDPRRLTISIDGSDRSIEPLAMRILMVLVEAEGRVVTREEVIDAVWPDGYAGEGSLSRAIWSLRQALGDNARSPDYIETVPRVGYRLKAEVKWSVKQDGRMSRLPHARLEQTNRRLRAAVVVLALALAGTGTGWIIDASDQSNSYEQFLKIKQPDGSVDSLHVVSEAPVRLSSTMFGDTVKDPSYNK